MALNVTYEGQLYILVFYVSYPVSEFPVTISIYAVFSPALLSRAGHPP